MTIVVRRATENDGDSIVRLLEAMHAENGLGAVNRQKALAVIADVLSNGIALIAEDNGHPVGTVGAKVASWWYSDDEYVGDYWTFVVPEARKTSAAIRLISALRQTAKAMKLPLVTGPVTPIEPEEKCRFYRRLGLRPIGGLFMEGI